MIKGLILSGNLDMVMVLVYVFVALAAQLGDERQVSDKAGELSNTAFVSREDVDDRVEGRLVDDFVVLWLTTTDADNTMCHRFKWIH